MSDIIKYGDLRKRRFWRLFFILFSLIGQETAVNAQRRDLLSTPIKFEHDITATTEEVIQMIAEQTGTTISYSSRTVENREISIEKGRCTVEEALNKVFIRFPVDYIVQGQKIIVAMQRKQYYRLSGFCRDALTTEALIGANVYDTLLYIGSAANDYGFFSLKLPAGNAAIRSSYVGYDPLNFTIDLTRDTLIELRLRPASMLKDIEIVGDVSSASESQTGVIALPMHQVQQVPTIFGTSDIIRALQMTTGVSGGEEGFGGMSVRGGSSDQNMVLLDDVPLYNPNHTLGLFTIFDSEGINSATLVKSGFPARYGGRMSSVLDVKTIEGNTNNMDGLVNVGLISANALLSGPVLKDKMSFTVSGRRTYADLYSSLIQKGRSSKYSFYFYDVMAKLNYRISQRDRVFVSFFTGYDHMDYDYNFHTLELEYTDSETRRVSINDRQTIYWGNMLVSSRWNHVYGNSLFSNVTVFYSRYRFNNELKSYSPTDVNTIYNKHYYSGINDLGLRADFTWYTPNIPGIIRIGANITHHRFYPGISMHSYKDSQRSNTDSLMSESATTFQRVESHAYIEEEFRVGRVTANVGVHLSALNRNGESPYVRLEPRISVGVKAAKRLLLSASYADITQFLQLLRVGSVSTPADMWLPTAKKFGSPHSGQFAFESKWSFSKNFAVTAEVYYKHFKNIQACITEPSSGNLSEDNWDELYTVGKGDARGIELFVHKKTGRISGWIGYTLSKAENRFEELNDNEWYPSDNDHRHAVQLFGTYKFNERIDLSASWTYKTGSYYTVSDGKYYVTTPDGSVQSFTAQGKRNNIQLPDSHVLNIGMNIRNQKPKTERILSFGIYNVYGRKNPMFVYWADDDNEAQTHKLKQFSLIAWPWPYIKYCIKF